MSDGIAINELAVLLPEEELFLPDGRRLTLRPWTLAQFSRAAGLLLQIIGALTPLGLTFENAEHFLAQRWLELLPAVLPQFPALIGLTFPELDPAGLDAGTQAGLGLKILLANKSNLKNFLTLALGTTPGAGASST